MSNDKLDAALVTFLGGCKRLSTGHTVANFPSLVPDIFSMTHGRKYTKVIRSAPGVDGGSVHCFIDRTNGDVLKAASWKAPAKHARGNVFDSQNGLGRMGPYGPAYLR